MRDHRLLHTPQKDHHHQIANRRTKFSSEISTKPASQKCLNSVFTPGSEIAASESSKDISSLTVTEAPDDNQIYQSLENLVASPSPSVSSAVASAVYDLSPLSSVITFDLSPFSSMITSTPSTLSSTITCDELDCGTAKSSVSVKRGSTMAKLAAKGFKQAGTKASNSNDMILLSKNVGDALLRIRIEELYDFLDEGSWLTETIQRRVFVVLRKVFGIFLSFVLLILICLGFFYFSGQCSVYEPSPT